LLGYNRFRLFLNLFGNAMNGKSTFFELSRVVFGDYFHDLAVQQLTRPVTGPDSANAGLVALKSKRLVMSSEPDIGDKFQSSTVKIITGGDLISSRTLYSAEIVKFKPMFVTWIMANSLLNFTEFDEAIKTRMSVVHFPVQYKRKHEILATDDKRFVVEADPRVKEVLCTSHEWRDELMIMLLELLPGIKDATALDPPTKVKEANDNASTQNLVAVDWFNSHYERTGLQTDKIPVSDVFNRFQTANPHERMSVVVFSKQMQQFGKLEKVRGAKGQYYVGIIEKVAEIE
jgi:phage/plasmid-associated DNA primase